MRETLGFWTIALALVCTSVTASSCGGAIGSSTTPQTLTVSAFSITLSPAVVLALDAEGHLNENDIRIGTVGADGRLVNDDGDELARLTSDARLVVIGAETAARIENGSVLEDAVVLAHLDDANVLTFPTRADLGPIALTTVDPHARTTVLFVVAAYFALVDVATTSPDAAH